MIRRMPTVQALVAYPSLLITYPCRAARFQLGRMISYFNVTLGHFAKKASQVFTKDKLKKVTF